MVPLAHASDGGGSIRNPASQTGLVGLKPSRGRVSLGPVWGESWGGLITEFAVTRSIRDTAALLDVLAGPMPGDPFLVQRPSRPYRMEATALPEPLRIGLLAHARDLAVHPECLAALRATARKLEDLGHTVVEEHPSALTDGSIDSFAVQVIGAAQALAIEQFEDAIGRRIGPSDVDADNWMIIEMGRGVTAAQYIGAVEAMHHYARASRVVDFDLLLTRPCPSRRRRSASWWRDRRFSRIPGSAQLTGSWFRSTRRDSRPFRCRRIGAPRSSDRRAGGCGDGAQDLLIRSPRSSKRRCPGKAVVPRWSPSACVPSRTRSPW
jgi:Asp-tRNA(Asn)/Glu-tRNA(Gln) amidotransferase A subunit family amidase